MKFVTISDTHGKHNQLTLPAGDVLIHAGDVSMGGKESEIISFLDWFEIQPFEFKILIAGNHDFYFENESDEWIQDMLGTEIIYLKDSGTVIGDFRVWGSPITPWFLDWAFNRDRGEQIKRHWDLIPAGTDILVTHGPVLQILDKTTRGDHVGCEDLLRKVQEIRPKVHICGHIHEAYGTVNKEGIQFINASVLDARYQLVNTPIVFEL